MSGTIVCVESTPDTRKTTLECPFNDRIAYTPLSPSKFDKRDLICRLAQAVCSLPAFWPEELLTCVVSHFKVVFQRADFLTSDGSGG